VDLKERDHLQINKVLNNAIGCVGVTWIYVTQDIVQWQAFVSKSLNLNYIKDEVFGEMSKY
jgi:hypothetical protein